MGGDSMTVDRNILRCDGYGCAAEAHLEVGTPTVGTDPEVRGEVRRRFASDGWTTDLSPFWQETLDFCPLHTPEQRAG